jgi:hypothetical protein
MDRKIETPSGWVMLEGGKMNGRARVDPRLFIFSDRDTAYASYAYLISLLLTYIRTTSVFRNVDVVSKKMSRVGMRPTGMPVGDRAW